MIIPTTIFLCQVFNPHIENKLKRAPITIVPKKALYGDPHPPVKLTPPTTAKAIAVNSNPTANGASTVCNLDENKIPATDAQKPLIIKAVITQKVTFIPAKRAVFSSPPIE